MQITVHKIHTYFSDTSLSIYLLFLSYFLHVCRIGPSINKTTSSHRVASSRPSFIDIFAINRINVTSRLESSMRIFSSRPLCSINEISLVGFQSRFYFFFLFTILRRLCNNSLKIVSFLLQSTITFFWLNKSYSSWIFI